MSEPNEMPLNLNEVARRPNRNFVGKVRNTLRNVTNYLQSNRTRAHNIHDCGSDDGFEIGYDARQWATDGPNEAGADPGLMTMIYISKKQRGNHPQCTICLDDYEMYEKAIKLNCGHIFHQQCINHWLSMHDTCPICRTYYCPFALHLVQERLGLFRSMARILYRTMRSPMAYLFARFGRDQPARGANRQESADSSATSTPYNWVHAPPSVGWSAPTPGDWSRVSLANYPSPSTPMMYGLENSYEETSRRLESLVESGTREIYERYISYHVWMDLQEMDILQRPGTHNDTAPVMRSRFSCVRAHVNPDPVPERPESQEPSDAENEEK